MSIWGVDQALPLPSIVTLASDVAVAGGGQVFLANSGTIVLPPSHNVLVWAFFYGVITLGAAPPTALTVLCESSNGIIIDTYTVPPSLLVASAVLTPVWLSIGAIARGGFTTGQNIAFGVSPIAQGVTVKAGTRMTFAFTIAADV